MSLKDLDIKLSYISCGEENIAKSFLVPALKQTKRYRRSVGFFSSGVFGPIIDGIVALSRNGGKIEFIASPLLSDEDIKAINPLTCFSLNVANFGKLSIMYRSTSCVLSSADC